MPRVPTRNWTGQPSRTALASSLAQMSLVRGRRMVFGRGRCAVLPPVLPFARERTALAEVVHHLGDLSTRVCSRTFRDLTCALLPPTLPSNPPPPDRLQGLPNATVGRRWAANRSPQSTRRDPVSPRAYATDHESNRPKVGAWSPSCLCHGFQRTSATHLVAACGQNGDTGASTLHHIFATRIANLAPNRWPPTAPTFPLRERGRIRVTQLVSPRSSRPWDFTPLRPNLHHWDSTLPLCSRTLFCPRLDSCHSVQSSLKKIMERSRSLGAGNDESDKSSSSCTWPLTSSRALWMAKLNRRGMRAVTEFGQTEVGQLYLTEFGQPQWTEFSLTFLVFGTRRGKEAEGLGPRTFGAPQGGAPIWCNGQEHPVCFSLSRRELRSQRHGPPKSARVGFSGTILCEPRSKGRRCFTQ